MWSFPADFEALAAPAVSFAVVEVSSPLTWFDKSLWRYSCGDSLVNAAERATLPLSCYYFDCVVGCKIIVAFGCTVTLRTMASPNV